MLFDGPGRDSFLGEGILSEDEPMLKQHQLLCFLMGEEGFGDFWIPTSFLFSDDLFVDVWSDALLTAVLFGAGPWPATKLPSLVGEYDPSPFPDHKGVSFWILALLDIKDPVPVLWGIDGEQQRRLLFWYSQFFKWDWSQVCEIDCFIFGLGYCCHINSGVPATLRCHF